MLLAFILWHHKYLLTGFIITIHTVALIVEIFPSGPTLPFIDPHCSITKKAGEKIPQLNLTS